MSACPYCGASWHPTLFVGETLYVVCPELDSATGMEGWMIGPPPPVPPGEVQAWIDEAIEESVPRSVRVSVEGGAVLWERGKA